MSTHNLCFKQKCEKYQRFLSENFLFLGMEFCIHLNRRVFVMYIYVWPKCGMYEKYTIICTLYLS